MSGVPSHSDLYHKFKNLGGKAIQCQVATFVSYEKATSSITVQLQNGLKIPGVRLKASVDKKTDYYVITIPRAKSTVLIGQIGDKPEAGEYFLVMMDEFETIEIKADKTKLVIDKTGVMFQNGLSAKFKQKTNGRYFIKSSSFNLYDVMEEFVTEVSNAQILISGVAGPYPLAVASAVLNPASKLKLESVWAKLGEILTKDE